jgi:beta-glucanase (GH16 family)
VKALAILALFGGLALAQVRVAVERSLYEVTPGEQLALGVTLSEALPFALAVPYRTEAGSAAPGRDFLPQRGVLVIPAGARAATLRLTTLDNRKPSGPLSFRVVLDDPGVDGVALSFRNEATVRLNHPPPPAALLADFERPGELEVTGLHALVTRYQGEAQARPSQGVIEGMLRLYEPATLSRRYPSAQDWRAASGIGFWLYGRQSGLPITATLHANCGPTPPAAEWPLIFHDTFDAPAGTPPDPATWRFDVGDGREQGLVGWGNNELQYYLPDNVAHNGQGQLAITALALAESELRCHYGPCRYSSGRIRSEGLLEVHYGRIEARLKLPEGQGLWPAFWMLGSDYRRAGWPTSGEIDIMEALGHDRYTVHGTVHGPGYSGGAGVSRAHRLPESFAARFYRYALEWEPGELRWYVDDEMFFRLTPDDVPGEWVFDQPFFLILNLAVGGNWPGAPDATTTFPQQLLIDELRIYALPETTRAFRATVIDDWQGWRFVELPFSAFSHPDAALDTGDIWGFSLALPATLLDAITLLD